MSLKDTARTVAALGTLHKAIGGELKAAKTELETGLRAEKKKTGTKSIGISLDDGTDIGTATIVQPDAEAVVTDAEKYKAWVMDHYASEIERRFVTEVRAAFTARLLKEMTAAGAAQWCNPETGEIHDVPGVTMQGRAAYTRLTVPDAGKAALAQAWREGRLSSVAPTVAPAAIESGDDETVKLRQRIAELEERDRWLSALEAAGVDNWEGYDIAHEIQNEGGDGR